MRLTCHCNFHRNEQHAVQMGRKSHRRFGCGEDRRTVQTRELHLGRRRRRCRLRTCEEGPGRRTCQARTHLTSSWSACLVRTKDALSSACFHGRDPSARSVSGWTWVRHLMRNTAPYFRGRFFNKCTGPRLVPSSVPSPVLRHSFPRDGSLHHHHCCSWWTCERSIVCRRGPFQLGRPQDVRIAPVTCRVVSPTIGRRRIPSARSLPRNGARATHEQQCTRGGKNTDMLPEKCLMGVFWTTVRVTKGKERTSSQPGMEPMHPEKAMER